MAKYQVQKEILLLTTSSYARKDLYDSRSLADGTVQRQRVMNFDKLEESCWNGLLDDLFRDAPADSKNGGKLFLWKIHVAAKFLCIELSQTPVAIDHNYSLDPYSFLPLKNTN